MYREVSSVEKSELQKSLSIHPKDTSIVLTDLFDPRASILSASLFEAGGEPLADPAIQHIATPGTILNKAAPQMLQHCQAHHGNTFLPLFPPGRLLHIITKKTNTSKATWSVSIHVMGLWCMYSVYYISILYIKLIISFVSYFFYIYRCCCGVKSECDVSVREVHNENLGTILVDKGMIEDHLPNHVLAALKLCWDKLLRNSPHYDPSKIKQLREKKEKLYRQVFRACKDGEQTGETGFTFLVNETPMSNEQRRLSAGGVARQRATETASEHHHQPPSLSVTVTADVHSEREVTDPSMATNRQRETSKSHPLELVARQGTSTQPRPKHLNLTVPTQSNLYLSTHSETLV